VSDASETCERMTLFSRPSFCENSTRFIAIRKKRTSAQGIYCFNMFHEGSIQRDSDEFKLA
jgi:hypothetical protein